MDECPDLGRNAIVHGLDGGLGKADVRVSGERLLVSVEREGVREERGVIRLGGGLVACPVQRR
ncbi:hypothetical protein KRMM14A1259_25960 [Krasilnikovia sp. MM14-A1259]